MDRVLAGLCEVFCYLDDILICSRSEEEHQHHLRQLFLRLRQHGLVINAEKCLFGVTSLDFLGHHITADGAAPLPAYVQAVADFSAPTTIKELQQFLGLINFYRRFLSGAAATLKPLTDALRGGGKGAEKLPWSPAMQHSFEAIKKSLTAATLLAHPRQGAVLSLAVDASATHIGACLQQRQPQSSSWQPLGFYSKKLEAAQMKYSAFDRELLACYLGIRHFRHLLEGRDFIVYTDHKPLVGALHRTSDPWTSRQCRQLSYVAEYTSDIRHISGKNNVVADTLSRPPQAALPAPASPAPVAAVAATFPPSLPFTLQELQAAQMSEPAASSSTSLQLQRVQWEGCDITCSFSTGSPWPLVPAQLRRRVFNNIHALAHPGIRATRRLVSARFVWPGLAKDVKSWCEDCQSCQRGKMTRQPAAPVEAIPIPKKRFSHVHVDLVGPLPADKKGSRYLLTMIDRSTRWLEATPLGDIEAATVADTFTRDWVARFGVPSTVTSDKGTQFTSSTWTALCSRLGIQHITTTAYHPQSNGMIERSHRQIKDALRARLAASDWTAHLPWVLLGLRAAPKEAAGISSAETVFGAPLTLPGDFILAAEPPPAAFLAKLQQSPLLPSTTSSSVRTYAQVAAAPTPQLCKAEFVYVRRGGAGPPLAPLYAGPYRVLDRAAKFFTVEMGGKSEVISVDRLKPHIGTSAVTPASPPLRGRPPLQSAVVPLEASPPAVSTLGGAPVAATQSAENPPT
jgi:cleavage and polyadenylation specificity factor subunit 1